MFIAVDCGIIVEGEMLEEEGTEGSEERKEVDSRRDIVLYICAHS